MDGIISKKHTYLDNYIKFGFKTSINMKKLKNNIILLKYTQSLGPINKFRGQKKISDDFKNFLLDLILNKKINTDTQKTLSQSDIKIFELMLEVTKLTDQLDYSRYIPTVEDYIHRFEILRGGFLAGNHSIEIREEMKDLLLLLSSKPINLIKKEDSDYFIEMLA